MSHEKENNKPGEMETSSLLNQIVVRLDELGRNLERTRLAEYVEMFDNPRRLLYLNFLMGLSRGFGMAIGFTILAAVVLWILQRLVVLNVPVIGDYIAEIVKWVQLELNVGGPNLPGGR